MSREVTYTTRGELAEILGHNGGNQGRKGDEDGLHLGGDGLDDDESLLGAVVSRV